MKKITMLTASAFAAAVLLTGCGYTEGWSAIPVDGKGDCYQIEHYKQQDWHSSEYTYALGIYCKAKVQP
jgi:hypothetical protein